MKITIDGRAIKPIVTMSLLVLLSACSPRHLIVQGVANEIASQSQDSEDDLILAREASAFYLKLSESLLREAPDNLKLAEAVAAGFTQYAFAFVSFEAEKLADKDAKAAAKLRQRAARLYQRGQRHALAALELQIPGFSQALASPDPAKWPQLKPEQVGVAYWAAASWGGLIAQSKDDPQTVADLPLAIRLARLAWEKSPQHGDGALASLMGSFEAAAPWGSRQQAVAYFDQAIAISAGKNAGSLVAKAESIALPAGDRPAFEALLHQALKASQAQHTLSNQVAQERAQWLLEMADDLF
ncbi:MAG: hypothetical protein FD135_1425 [Comamonadaceae bacterium]|nr:MAG: hypothetical protein FD135_1425 [Comamonadaceae bacterium]